jgi:hypothetical protein
MRRGESSLTRWGTATNSGDSLAGRLRREVFPFEVGSAPVVIRSKAARFEVAKVMAQQLTIYVNAGFQYPLTDDESWMLYGYRPSRMWTIARSEVDPIARPTSYHRKTMMTVSSKCSGINTVFHQHLFFILPHIKKLFIVSPLRNAQATPISSQTYLLLPVVSRSIINVVVWLSLSAL